MPCGTSRTADKNNCKGLAFQINPFTQRFGKFSCGSNDYEYTYIFNSSKQIDSLVPTCRLRNTAFPIDETNMKYLILGRLSYYRGDTFQTNLLKDTCLKTLTYEVNMIQRDTTRPSFYPQGGVRSMYCAVENIPSDYKVEMKYKYVPLK